MAHGKKTKAGVAERLDLLQSVSPNIEHHLQNRPANVGKDDLLDAAVAAWTALRIYAGDARRVSDLSERAFSGGIIIAHAVFLVRTRSSRQAGEARIREPRAVDM
jgi:predicted RNase H-like nuclease